MAETPTFAQVICRDDEQLLLRANALDEYDKLELEEYDGIDGRSTVGGRVASDENPHQLLRKGTFLLRVFRHADLLDVVDLRG